MEFCSVVPVEGKRNTGEQIGTGTEVASLAISEIAQIALIMHAEEVHADDQIAVLGGTPGGPVRSAVSVDALVVRYVNAGDILSAPLDIPAGKLVAGVDMDLAGVADYTSPGVADRSSGHTAFIAQPRK